MLRGCYTFILVLYTCCHVITSQGTPPRWTNVEELRERIMTDGVPEDTRTGAVLGALEALAFDESDVTYSTDNQYVSIHQTSGVVRLERPLDAEVLSEIPVEFICEDENGSTNTASMTLNVRDVNDNAPAFENLPYNFQVLEDARPGALIADSIYISDADITTANNRIDVQCIPLNQGADGCSVFTITHVRLTDSGSRRAQVELRLGADGVNYEQESTYVFTLRATDSGTPAETATTRVVIQVEDTDDSPPVFVGTQTNWIIAENRAVGSVLKTVQVRDGDSSGNEVRLDIVHDPSGLFSLGDAVVDRSGLYRYPVLSNGNLDADTLGNNYQIILQATEISGGRPTNLVNLTIDVTLQDENDNVPVFTPATRSITIPEALPEGTAVPGLDLTVEDIDSPIHNGYELRLVRDQFGVFSVTPQRASGIAAVTLNVLNSDYLDYEESIYRTHVIEIEARETSRSNPQSSTATVTITLNNVNDEVPRFAVGLYEADVRSDRQAGYTVVTVSAVDRDFGEFGDVRYSITDGGLEGKFRIDSITGRITLTERMGNDVEQVTLTVQAQDGGGRQSSVAVLIRVIDAGVDVPEFEQGVYETQVEELQDVLNPPVIATISGDEVVEYRILSGNTPDSAFVIDAQTGELTLRRALTYQDTPDRQGIFTLVLGAGDPNQPFGDVPDASRTTVRVTVIDVNDNTPEFDRTVYRTTVTEIAVAGTSIVTVSAEDEDAGRNSELVYTIVRGDLGSFSIDPSTGVITVASNANIDRDQQDVYTLTVRATDRGSPPLWGETTVEIRAIDANNKPPVFDNQLYSVIAREDATLNSIVAVINARDTDSGAVLRYSMVSGSLVATDRRGVTVPADRVPGGENFVTIDQNSGEIRLNELQDRDNIADYTFDVIVVDVNTQAGYPNNDTATVTITIQGSDDVYIYFNSPWTINNPTIPISLDEGRQIGDLVTTLVARESSSGRLVSSYRIREDNEASRYFRLVTTGGQILIAQQMDYEIIENKVLSFEVVATYLPANGLPISATANLVITLRDVNDNAPRFTQPAYSFTLEENSSGGTIIGRVRAVDDDSGSFGEIAYSFNTGEADARKFDINNRTGEIRVSENAVLDYEEQREFGLTVRAIDNPSVAGNQLSTDTILIIYLLDLNDNSPQFSQEEYNAFISETTQAGDIVATMNAPDRDSGAYGSVTYTITPLQNEASGLFTIESRTGRVVTTRVPINEARPEPYRYTITARDGGETPLTDRATLYITVTGRDEEIVIYTPNRDNAKIYIDENLAVGSELYQIEARDANPGSGGLVYSFYRDTTEGSFTIDASTGVITNNRVLDRERDEFYQLFVEVRDDSGNFARRQFLLYLNNVDEFPPTFVQCSQVQANPKSVYSPLDNTADVITTVRACDEDYDDDSVRNYYYITCGVETTDPLFLLHKESGEMRLSQVVLPDEADDYQICVRVSSDPNLDLSRYEDSYGMDDSQVLSLLITRDEEQSENKGGLTLEDLYAAYRGTPVRADISSYMEDQQTVVLLSVSRYDADADDNNPYLFSVTSSRFRSANGTVVDAPGMFTVDTSGVVETNRTDYTQYVGGRFELGVQALDPAERTVITNTVWIQVVHTIQLLKFVFDDPVEDVNKDFDEFEGKLERELNVTIEVDSVKAHRQVNRKREDDRTDVCFRMSIDDSSVSQEQAKTLLEENQRKLNSLYNDYNVERVEVCDSHMDTTRWSGWSWLWWILIVIAIIIFLITLIMIIIICCIYKRYKNYMDRNKPYIVIDADVDSIQPHEYEWQQDSMTMHSWK